MEIKNSERFLASYNRINKWLIEKTNFPKDENFGSLLNLLVKQKHYPIEDVVLELRQFSKLRNAIVHDQTDVDFTIAEPNDWAVERIEEIEEFLLNPEKVIPRFQKEIRSISKDMPLHNFLEHVAARKYTFYPVIENGMYLGLITLKSLAILLSEVILSKDYSIKHLTLHTLLKRKEKQAVVRFVSDQAEVNECKQMFLTDPNLEAIFISQTGDPSGKILGMIRPSDLFRKEF